jgi:hypothetical protein
LTLAATLPLETRRLAKLRASRDMRVYLAIWVLALAAVVADQLELPWLRPLEWIRMMILPLNKLIP